MGFSSENRRNLSVLFCLMPLYTFTPPRVDGSIIKLKGIFGVCDLELLPGSISLKGIPVQYTICFRSEGSPSHLDKGEKMKHYCIIYSALLLDIFYQDQHVYEQKQATVV